MKKLLKFAVVLFSTAVFAQAGHIMQGVGAVNMSMGGAATAQQDAPQQDAPQEY